MGLRLSYRRLLLNPYLQTCPHGEVRLIFLQLPSIKHRGSRKPLDKCLDVVPEKDEHWDRKVWSKATKQAPYLNKRTRKSRRKRPSLRGSTAMSGPIRCSAAKTSKRIPKRSYPAAPRENQRQSELSRGALRQSSLCWISRTEGPRVMDTGAANRKSHAT